MGIAPAIVYRSASVTAARKDSAVHVSLSSDSPVKQPGSARIPSLQKDRRAAEASPPTTGRRPVTAISEELRRRAIAPSGGAPCEAVYRPRPRTLSTMSDAVFLRRREMSSRHGYAAQIELVRQYTLRPPNRNAVLRPDPPYCSHNLHPSLPTGIMPDARSGFSWEIRRQRHGPRSCLGGSTDQGRLAVPARQSPYRLEPRGFAAGRRGWGGGSAGWTARSGGTGVWNHGKGRAISGTGWPSPAPSISATSRRCRWMAACARISIAAASRSAGSAARF